MPFLLYTWDDHRYSWDSHAHFCLADQAATAGVSYAYSVGTQERASGVFI